MIASITFKQHHQSQFLYCLAIECGKGWEAEFMSVDGYRYVRIN